MKVKPFIEQRISIYEGERQRIIVNDDKGYVWVMSSAEPFPTDEEVLDLFRTQKTKFFGPYYGVR